MAVSTDFLTYLIDQLAPFARVRSRRMFGGVGLYADDLFFAIVADDVAYFKVDDSNRNNYTARGCKAFQPFTDEFSMNYFEVPSEVIEDSDELVPWARKAVAVAMAARAAKAPKKKMPALKRRKSTVKRPRK